MTITFDLEPRDVQGFYRWALKHSPAQRSFRRLYWIPAALLALQATLAQERRHLATLVITFCLLTGFVWLIMRVLGSLLMRLLSGKSVSAQTHRLVICTHTIALEEDAVVEATPLSEARVKWAGVTQVADASDSILILTAPDSAHIIPKRAFPNAEAARLFFERAASLQAAAQAARA